MDVIVDIADSQVSNNPQATLVTYSLGSCIGVVIWDPEATGSISAATHHHRVDTNIFEGFKTKGAPSSVIVNGVMKPIHID